MGVCAHSVNNLLHLVNQGLTICPPNLYCNWRPSHRIDLSVVHDATLNRYHTNVTFFYFYWCIHNWDIRIPRATCKIVQCISIKVVLLSYYLVHARKSLGNKAADMLHPAMETIGNIQHNIELKITHFSIPKFTRMEENWLLHWYWRMNKAWVSVAKSYWTKPCYAHYCFIVQHRCALQMHYFQHSFNRLW